MAVASANPFSLLNDDEGLIADQTPQKEEPKSGPPLQQRTPKSKSGPASKGGRYYARGGPPKQETRETEEEANAVRDTRRDAADVSGRGGRGRGRGRGDRGGRGRQYDRHSGTGKVDSDKKIHQGWGGDEGNTERVVEEAAIDDAAAEAAPTNSWGIEPATENGWGDALATTDAEVTPAVTSPANDAREARRREEEEDNTMTYEQYLAQKKTVEAPKVQTRKPNEGADESIWEGAVVLSKEEEDDFIAQKTHSTRKPKAKKEEKQTIEINVYFERPQRGGRGGFRGGDRGGERSRGRGGGGRGGRGRDRDSYGGGENGRNAGSRVDVDDQSAFPALS